jgi:ABC-type multidrug transport system ATPase subunit
MVLMLDEATVGLDSSSTLALVQSMSSWAKLLNTTIVMALQQPEPAVTALFDDVILMAEGYTLWHGPIGKNLAHFEGITGVKALPGQDLADYLMQVAATPTQQQQQQEEGLIVTADGSSGSRVMSAAQLSAAFWASQQGTCLKVGLK